MPEKYFHIRWPDGDEEKCYSPSSVIETYLKQGATYHLTEFVALTEEALNEASERVRAKYGYACSSAMDQLANIKARAAGFDAEDNPQVSVNKIS